MEAVAIKMLDLKPGDIVIVNGIKKTVVIAERVIFKTVVYFSDGSQVIGGIENRLVKI